MNKEDLKKLGIEDEELAKQIIILHGKDIESIKASEQSAIDKVTELTGQLTEAGKTIEGFKKLDVEGIQKAADEYKTKFEQAQAESATKLTALKFDHALDTALAGVKAKNPKAVRALLQLDALKLSEDGNALEGFEEQITKVKETDSFLFADEKPEPKIVVGANNQSVISDKTVDAARTAAGLTK